MADKKRAPSVISKLTDAERDLLWHMEHGYELQTDSLGGDPILRPLKGEVVRPAFANGNTVKALQERGLISPRMGRSRLTIVWRVRSSRLQNS